MQPDSASLPDTLWRSNDSRSTPLWTTRTVLDRCLKLAAVAWEIAIMRFTCGRAATALRASAGHTGNQRRGRPDRLHHHLVAVNQPDAVAGDDAGELDNEQDAVDRVQGRGQGP